MKDKLFHLTRKLHPARLTDLGNYLIKDEAISGKLILVAVLAALAAANSPLAPWYDALLHSKFTFEIASLILSIDLKHFINEGLMVFFFLVVGLELKRELLHGELRHRETAILPFAAAIGGMVVPATIYLAFNYGQETVNGWAIPTATDIALALGILGLIGNRIPSSLRIFILALAIVDDILAVTIIAIFYNPDVNISGLAAVLAVGLWVYLLGRLRLLPLPAFIIAGVVLWGLMYITGVHASIVGALLGLIAPMSSHRHPGEQIAERTERAIIPFSTLVVVPIFAFANTGVSFDFGKIQTDSIIPLGGGILFGFLVGKALGIFAASWLMVKLKFARLPAKAGWAHILGVGILAGVGFTVAIFVTDLAFADENLVTIAKLSIFISSILAAILGLFTLRYAKTR